MRYFYNGCYFSRDLHGGDQLGPPKFDFLGGYASYYPVPDLAVMLTYPELTKDFTYVV